MLMLLLACTRGADDTGAAALFRQDFRDAGLPHAGGEGFTFSSSQQTAFGFEHVVPGVVWGNSPPTEMVLVLWDYVQGENIADPGVCPYKTADGASTTWNTNCRSADGYDWDGSVTSVVWEEGGQEWEHWTFDLVLESDIEGRKFDRIALDGQYYFGGRSDDEGVLSHTQANYTIDAVGYWSGAFKDEVEPAWHGLSTTGTWETWDDGTYVFNGLMDLGEHGGFAFTTEGMEEVSNCVREPKGEMTMTTPDSTAVLTFEGAGQCDGCAQLDLDGVRQNTACDQSYL